MDELADGSPRPVQTAGERRARTAEAEAVRGQSAEAAANPAENAAGATPRAASPPSNPKAEKTNRTQFPEPRDTLTGAGAGCTPRSQANTLSGEIEDSITIIRP